jgi:hypothetical protein
MDRVIDDYLTFYTADNARISDVMKLKGGNCEAQTKIVISAYQAARYTPPDGMILAVQNFTDHIQPVYYNPKTDEVGVRALEWSQTA